MAKIAAVAFDVLGTMFSLAPLRGRLEAAGLPGHTLETWFAESLCDAFAMAAAGNGSFAPLQEVLSANLDALFHRHGVVLGQPRKGRVLAGLTELQTYPDAAEAFGILADAGLPVLALSNGARAETETLLQSAGLRNAVRRVVCVDEVGLSKPRREVYRHAAERAGVAPEHLAPAAAHPWDVHGAKLAGLVAGFVSRGLLYPPVMTAPDVEGTEPADVARELARPRG